MNNEEKILEILMQMQVEQQKTNDRLASLEASQAKLEASQAKLEADVTKIAVTQENVVLPQLQLLSEGHTVIQEQIKRLSVIDALQDDVATLKNAVRFISQELDQLKSAI